MKKLTDGPDFTKDDWDWEDLLKWGNPEDEDDYWTNSRATLVAKGEHIHKSRRRR